jgi:phosphohistidine swiveling domain-containing protein
VGPQSGRALPRWWREALAALAIYVAYSVSRGLTMGDQGDEASTGQTLLNWERSWHLAPEHALNQLLWHLPALAVAASYFYAVLHYVVTPAVLVWMYRRNPDHYRTARNTLVVATLLGLVGFWLLPTTPPRMLAGSGFHDTLADVSGWGWWSDQASAPRGFGGLTNQHAAMPSLHVGWALWSGWLIARHARRRAARLAGAIYPILTALVVMATGNHYLLDAVGGAADVALAAGTVALVGWAIHATRSGRPEPGTALPAVVRLSADGRAIPARLDRGRRDDSHANGVHGLPAGGGVGAGAVYHGDTPEIGAVLVVDALEPRLAVLLPGLAGLVSATGSPLSHLAVLARELGVPTVVGVPDARHALPAGTHVVVDGNLGRVDVVPDSPVGLAADLPEPVREYPNRNAPGRC